MFPLPALCFACAQDAVVVPVGGGGLIAGMALFLRHINPRIKIYGQRSPTPPPSPPVMHNAMC